MKRSLESVVHSTAAADPVWPHLTLAPLRLVKRINKRALAISPELWPTARLQPGGETTQTTQRRGLRGAAGRGGEEGRVRGEKKPHIGTQSSHLKSTDRGCVEANKRGSKCDTVHSVRCLAAAEAAVRAPLKSESPSASFLPDQTSTSSLRSEPRCSRGN